MPILLWIFWVAVFSASLTISAESRDDGRYANSDLKPWFDSLASGNGLCCSFADGLALKDVDWDTQDGHYRVRIEGEWVDVPEKATITQPNKFGAAVVWPWKNSEGKWQVRCFIPGSGA